MASTPSTAERKIDRAADASEQKERDLDAIDDLIHECRGRLSTVSGSVFSYATKSSIESMWKDLRREAEIDDLRAERLQWAQGALAFLNDNIEKAQEERAKFESELTMAVEKKWIPASDVAPWMSTFDDPGLLEMYRSAWLKNEWRNTYLAGWKKLGEKRDEVLSLAEQKGLTEKELPTLGTVKRHELFLARKFPERRSMVDALRADIVAYSNGTTARLKEVGPLVERAASGPGRCLHPAKVGAWMEKIASDPKKYTKEAVTGYVADWAKARAEYDALAERFEKEGRPDGCVPMALNAFLALPYEARLATLAETRNRFAAAKRLDGGTDDGFDQELREIRRSVDLKDLDAADVRLAGLRMERPNDPDVRSIGEHIAMLRAERDKNDVPDRSESERTEDALESLRGLRGKLPASVAAHYAYLIERGDADQAALFFQSMKARTDRVASGRTSRLDDHFAAQEAQDADEATEAGLASSSRTSEDIDDAQVLAGADTPPATTMQLLKQHGGKDAKRFPALVLDISYDQQRQLVELNERTLADMRHLDSVGKRYQKTENSVAA